METGWGGETGVNGESIGAWTHAHCQARETAGEKLLCNTGSPAPPLVMTQRDEGGEEREAQERGYMCIIVADLHCCMSEITTMW